MKTVTVVTNCDFTEQQRLKLEEHGEFISNTAKKLQGDDLIQHIGDAEAAIIGSSGVEEVDENVLKACPNLKYISIFGSGTDFVDIDAATRLGIKISNLQGANSQSVAEHTWGMILNLSKRILDAHIGAKEGNHSFLDYLGIEMQGKTLGIIGYGEIGERVAKIATGFDMNIISYTRNPKLIDGVEFVDLDRLLVESDVITVSVPLTDETDGMIAEDELNKMKNTAILVNTSRESIIDKTAILNALSKKSIFGFGMELEINTKADSEFNNFENVVITPHNGMFTVEAEERCADMVVENVIDFIKGTPKNLVN